MKGVGSGEGAYPLPSLNNESFTVKISELLSEQQHTTGAATAAETDLLQQAHPIAHALWQAPDSTLNTDVITVFSSADVGHFDLGFYVRRQ